MDFMTTDWSNFSPALSETQGDLNLKRLTLDRANLFGLKEFDSFGVVIRSIFDSMGCTQGY